MTGTNILKAALSFMGAKLEDNEIEADVAVNFINIIMQESLSCENSIREAKNLVRYKVPPFINLLSDEVAFSEELCRVSFPYALCSYIYLSEEDNYNSIEFRNKYIMSLSDFCKINFG